MCTVKKVEVTLLTPRAVLRSSRPTIQQRRTCNSNRNLHSNWKSTNPVKYRRMSRPRENKLVLPYFHPELRMPPSWKGIAWIRSIVTMPPLTKEVRPLKVSWGQIGPRMCSSSTKIQSKLFRRTLKNTTWRDILRILESSRIGTLMNM